jgi:hypothetical protein
VVRARCESRGGPLSRLDRGIDGFLASSRRSYILLVASSVGMFLLVFHCARRKWGNYIKNLRSVHVDINSGECGLRETG